MRYRLAALGLGVSTALAGPLTGQALAADPLSIEDLFKIKQARQVATAPDGSAMAYTLSIPVNVAAGEENGRATSEVRLATAAGDSRLYLPASLGASSLDWRDNKTLTFLAKAEGDKTRTLYGIHVGGGAPQKIFAHKQNISRYAFADEGKILFFSAQEPKDATAEKLKKKGFNANIVDEGDRFTRLYRVDLSKVDAKPVMLELEGNVSNFAASPDGRRLVVALAKTPLVNDDIINRTYHIVNGRNGRVENTIDTVGKIGPAAFSPEGDKIAFLAGIDRPDPIAHTLAVADARTGAFSFLTGEDEVDEMDFAWISNSSLRVLAHRSTASEMFTLSTDGEVSDRQVHEGFVVSSFDGGGEIFGAIAHGPKMPRSLFATQNGGELTQWSNHNTWLGDRKLGDQRLVTWTARDGVEVEGLLITPQGRMPRGGWPMITVVHGGPEAHYSNGWLTHYADPGHVGAGMGYAVFYPNYRGSTGRGQWFAKLDHVDPPAVEFNDVVDGVEYLAEDGQINEDKVGITGGSYGGFASAWGATALTEHFAASVAFVGLTNLTSFMGTTDIPEEMIDSHFMVPPEEDWDLYLEWSPIYHAAKSKTPTLILHGEEDPRVHPAQSLELYRYLKRVGQAPVRLVTYPGEGHGNRMAAARYDYSLRLMRWMDFYLKGDGKGMPPAAVPELEELVK